MQGACKRVSHVARRGNRPRLTSFSERLEILAIDLVRLALERLELGPVLLVPSVFRSRRGRRERRDQQLELFRFEEKVADEFFAVCCEASSG
jgi:hypothetical protein